MQDYPVENLLREPTEIYTSMTCLALALLAVSKPHLFLLTKIMGNYAGFSLGTLSLFRGLQALRIKRFHRRLIQCLITRYPQRKYLSLSNGFLLAEDFAGFLITRNDFIKLKN